MRRLRLLALLALPAIVLAQDNGREDRLSVVTRAQYDAQRTRNREMVAGLKKEGTLRLIVADVRETESSRATRKRIVARLQALGLRVMDVSEGTDASRISDGNLPILSFTAIPRERGTRRTSSGTLWAKVSESAILPRNGKRFVAETWHYADDAAPSPGGEVSYQDPQAIDALVDRIVAQFVEDFKATNK